jgi:hypothetical protein
MDSLLLMLLGAGLGVFFTLLWLSLRGYWRRSRELNAAAAKARKEMQEKSLKARTDAQKARDSLFRAVLQVVLLTIAIVVVAWLIWTVILL